MGLDIYLKVIPNKDSYDKEQEAYESANNKLFNEICGSDENVRVPDEKYQEYRAKCKELEASMGLEEYGGNPFETSIREDSKLYPEHLCKIGYLRSSYNEGGFNAVARTLLGKDLYWIFDKNNEEYQFKPDWEATLRRAEEFKKELLGKIEESHGCGVMEVSGFGDEQAMSGNEALQSFIEESKKNAEYGDYSNKRGYFFPEGPLEVTALIHGKGFLGQPCTYVIYKKNSQYEFYVQMIDIVIENCKFVLAHPCKSDMYVNWSS